MEEELKKHLERQDEVLEEIYTSAEKTRKYILVTIVFSLVAFVIPLVILIFVLPSFIKTLTAI